MTASKFILFNIITAIPFLFSACARRPVDRANLTTNEARTETAVVESVLVTSSGSSPGQLKIVASGYLNDECMALAEPEIKRLANTFSVTLKAVRPAEANCASKLVDYEKTISIDTGSLAAETYIVTVNGVTEIVFLPGTTRSITGAGQTEAPAQASAASSNHPDAAGAIPATMNAPSASEAETEDAPPETRGPTPNPDAAGEVSRRETTSSQTESSKTGLEVSPAAETSAAGNTVSGMEMGECSDKAAFYGDVTVPDDTHFRQGEAFVKTWRLRNEGTCTWGEGYALVFIEGDLMGAVSPQPLTSTVSPGEIAEVSVSLTAPHEGGPRYSNWMLSNGQGLTFGVGMNARDPIWTRIIVNWIAPPGELIEGPGSCRVERNPSYEGEALALINNYRSMNSLDPLVVQEQLTEAAVRHSTDMACRDFLGHIGSDGMDWFGRIATQGYSYSLALENLYNGDPTYGGTPQGAMKFWMESFIHNRNMLDPQVTEIGIGYVFYPDRKPADNTYSAYYTTVFARP